MVGLRFYTLNTTAADMKLDYSVWTIITSIRAYVEMDLTGAFGAYFVSLGEMSQGVS